MNIGYRNTGARCASPFFLFIPQAPGFRKELGAFFSSKEDALMKRWSMSVGLGLLAILAVSNASAQTFNVVDYGTVTQNTDIRLAIEATMGAANNVPGQDVIQFPSGTYYWGSGSAYTSTDSVVSAGFKPGNWIFQGTGRDTTIIKASASAADNRIFRCISCDNVTIRNMSFDHNGGAQFGGILFYNTENVLIENTRFFDSTMAGRPAQVSNDINSYVFGRAGGHRNLVFRNNLIEDLQVDFSAVDGGQIYNNTILRAWGTAALGFYSTLDVVSDAELPVIRNVSIASNTIVGLSSVTVGIAVHIDPAIQGSTPFKYQRYQNFKIVDNRIFHSSSSLRTGYAIKVGQTDNSKQTTGFIFDDIEIARNQIYVSSGTTFTGTDVIQLMASRPTTGYGDFQFTKTRVYDNTLYGVVTSTFIGIYPDVNQRRGPWNGYSR